MKKTKQEDFIREYNELTKKYGLQVIPQITLAIKEIPEVKEE